MGKITGRYRFELKQGLNTVQVKALSKVKIPLFITLLLMNRVYILNKGIFILDGTLIIF